MKDIDFDELDRAVSSLMGGVPKAEPAEDKAVSPPAAYSPAPTNESELEQAQIVSSVTPSVPVNEAPSVEESPKPPLSAPSAAIAPPAVRRGRFMDMVRPVASETKKPVPSRAVSRQGATIQPINGFARPATSSIDGITLSTPQPAPQQPEAASSGDLPDPLAGVEFDKTTEAITVKTTQTTPLSVQAIQNPGMRQPEVTALSDSPFLPDAKVEKRPLGRLADTGTASQAAPEPDHAPVLGALADPEVTPAEGTAASAGDMASPEQPMPAELGHEVMAIEADTSSPTIERPKPAVPEVEAAPVRLVAQTPAPSAVRPVATSIPQQYKVQPKAAEPPTTGAIYDTAAYHQPLTHPAKKKPGWLWVLAIILILLLGAASGAAVYFFGLV